MTRRTVVRLLVWGTVVAGFVVALALLPGGSVNG